MAGADYYSCDVCGGKAFYDANLDYDDSKTVNYGCGAALGYVGEMAVICTDCAKTHEIKIVERAAPAPAKEAP